MCLHVSDSNNIRYGQRIDFFLLFWRKETTPIRSTQTYGNLYNKVVAPAVAKWVAHTNMIKIKPHWPTKPPINRYVLIKFDRIFSVRVVCFECTLFILTSLVQNSVNFWFLSSIRRKIKMKVSCHN